MKTTNDSAFIVGQYFRMKSWAKLGYTKDLSELDVFSSRCFGIISEEIAKLEDADLKKRKRK